MSLVLPRPGDRYERSTEDQRNRLIERADAQSLKRGQDIEVGDARLILRAPNGTRYALTVDNAGVLGTEAA